MTARFDRDTALLFALFIAAAASTAIIHFVYLPRYVPDSFITALPFLVVGWAGYGLAFYALGRLFASPSDVPNLRAADTGVALVLVAVVISGILNTAGLPVRTAPIAHLLPTLGVYVGLALAGWGFGKRTTVVNRLTNE
ncbi:MAG: hypothetical protein ACI8UR_000836 [Natronomonas sp.]|jgi:hypothetical protein|uniref:hypothetical protein n=1 Tax=Natronomonas sp. TaxID=2184060 RepID=UPI0039895376